MRIGLWAASALLSGIVAMRGDNELSATDKLPHASPVESCRVTYPSSIFVFNDACKDYALFGFFNKLNSINYSRYTVTGNLPIKSRGNISPIDDRVFGQIYLYEIAPIFPKLCVSLQSYVLSRSVSEVFYTKLDLSNIVVNYIAECATKANADNFIYEIYIRSKLFCCSLSRKCQPIHSSFRACTHCARHVVCRSGAMLHSTGTFGGELHHFSSARHLLLKSLILQDGVIPRLGGGSSSLLQGSIVSVSTPLRLRGSFFGPMRRTVGKESGNAGENNSYGPKADLPEGVDSLSIGDAIRGTVDSEAFPLVSGHAVGAILLGFGFVAGGLGGSLYVASLLDRRRAKQQERSD